jgi:hypothetical protein
VYLAHLHSAFLRMIHSCINLFRRVNDFLEKGFTLQKGNAFGESPLGVVILRFGRVKRTCELHFFVSECEKGEWKNSRWLNGNPKG